MEISTEEVLKMQFQKVGQLHFTIDLLNQQIIVLQEENKLLKEKSDE